MSGRKAEPIRAGGQALADGVMMRTPLAWAIARQDGTVEVGQTPNNPLAAFPVLRVIYSLGGALKLGFIRGMLRPKGAATESRRVNRRFLNVLVGTEGLVVFMAYGMKHLAVPGWADTAMNLLPWIVVLGVLRVASPQAMWRYHGAEHKAVTAMETGVDLNDTEAVLECTRIHNRCGTNLVALLAVCTLALLPLRGFLQAPAMLLCIGAGAELLSFAARRPSSVLSRLLVAPGRFLQRHVTTQEPTRAEQAVGCHALLAALAEHARVEAAIVAAEAEAVVAQADEIDELAPLVEPAIPAIAAR
jgi:uncharacterized protein YqhQ